MAVIHDSLARANGRGSAGQCLASHRAKTPAVRESASRVATVASARDIALAMTHPAGASAPLIQQLRGLQAAARRYYAHSDLTSLTDDGLAAADDLARLLGYPEQRT